MSDSRQDGQPKLEAAEERTDWAEDRTILANERTFGSWIRTGLVTVAIAIGLHAVFGELPQRWLARGTASLFLASAIFIFLSAAHRAGKTRRRTTTHTSAVQPLWRMWMWLLAITLSFGTFAVGLVLWMI
ncbi:DUF202 domain-containing protein [Falsirhodobacter deserti]|uniref:DUF202 domain-containing protein n=1 Tax=Falsirhodobacter deserti TaxID=1365611 RepID=UPI000FE3C880|nr:DUF202 domain-containing protein [Falsirhodobacter deserti]